ncbi:MAG: DUF1501 domain-containing protein [Anaerolineae bacterium]|nr:DUF1501 domain-containing protein [Anaerolineae bacterium]NUQ02926.1 DUF1501 domain-containing protein [Anaerolineae bacterium]
MPTRRDFLRGAGALGAVGVSKRFFPAWMPRLAFRQASQASRGDVLVAIFLRGGIDGLSVVVPYGDGAHYYDARPTQAVAEPGSGSSAALDLDGYFGFHPAFAPLIDIYQGGALSVVHATGSIDPSRSHFDAMQFMEYGTPGSKTTGTGWIGRHLQTASWQNDSPFRAVGMGAMSPASLRGATPLSLRSIADFHLRGREGELRRAQQSLMHLYSVSAPQDALQSQAGLVFETIDLLQALNAVTYQPANGAVYPEDEEGFGMGLRQIAQLIKANVGLEVACLDLGGWDTHENQGTHDGYFQSQLAVLAQGLSAFYADMQDLMPGVTVVTMSEFGRRVAENGSAGTDHGHGNFMLVMGGGAQGGRVYADWPTLAPEVLNDGDLAITTDYRDVLAEILTYRLNNPALDQVFPNFTPTPRGIVTAR